ncbi:hypothetical protein [Curtobacterium sp. VKM Ac-2852]|uniref:hypothetical protein n=1 Tax=Curtobacterium sp. VKM Ac-2852 TaxID=2739024 RepID=UPI0015669076|nr:hypothetical protein [Curtobacterium sp. VKM Ac-2852]NQX22672.1 hypothetical protein [Curtobacterium sp. VKM Ac-2852]
MSRRSTRGFFVCITVAAVAASIVTAPLTAQADDAPNSAYTVYVPGVTTAQQSNLNSMLLVSPGCGTGAKEDDIIHNWERRPGSSTTAHLRCGTQAEFGLRHINHGHGQDWENVRSKYAQPGTWDSFMEDITVENLISASTRIDDVNNKDVYRGYLCVRENSDGEVIRAYDTIIPVGRGSNNIITSYFENGRASDPHC